MRAAKTEFTKRLLLSTALVVPGLIGYGSRRAYAQSACANAGGSTYLCSGAINSSQTINAANADVTMDAGATINVPGGYSGQTAITITGDGDLSFTNTAGGGIYGDVGLSITAGDGLPGGSVTVNATQDVDGFVFGIDAENNAAGALTINAAGVSGFFGDGIRARNYGTDLSVTATGTVSSNYGAGINASNSGTGALTVNAFEVSSEYGTAIDARNGDEGDGTSLTITATGDVDGQQDGIRATNNGSGALTIDVANVAGNNGSGIYARNGYYGTDLSITATGIVTGYGYGDRRRKGGDGAIVARNNGYGALTINVVDVTGTSGGGEGGYGGEVRRGGKYGTGVGINAYNSYNGTDLSITSTGTVTGERYGVQARNEGYGALTINVVDVVGSNGAGIDARNSNNGTGLSITATGTVTGVTRGYGFEGGGERILPGAITAINSGDGALTINVVDVTGSTGGGEDGPGGPGGDGPGGDGEYGPGGPYGYGGIAISAFNGEDGTDISITSTGTVTGDLAGIGATNEGTGALTITVVDVVSDYFGIGAYTSDNGTALNITSTGTVSGDKYGIQASNSGSGALTINVVDVTSAYGVGIYGRSGEGGATINVTGDVTGGEVGIRLESEGDTEINIAEGASVSGGNFSIDTAHGAGSDDTINLRGTLDGDAQFGAGDDLLTIFSTAVFGMGTTDIDGGDDTDTLELTGDGIAMLDGALHSNFEHLEKTGTGTWTLTGDHNIGTSSSIFEGTLDIAGNLISPEVTNEATLAVGGVGAVGMGTVTGNLTQTAAGTFAVDIDGDAGTADLLTVTGAADLAGAVLPAVTGTVVSGDAFTILTAAGGATDSGLSVDNTAGFDFIVEFIGNDVVLTVEEARTVLEALNSLGDKNQNQVASYLDGLKETDGLSDELADLITALLALPDETALAGALNKLIPSHLSGQIDTTVLNTQTFGNAVMSCGVSSGAYAFVREGQCTWAKVTGRYKHHDATNGTFGFRESAGGIAGGLQIALHDEWRFGWAFDYERSEVVVGNLAETEGDRVQGGVIVKNRWGGTTLAAAFTGGFGWLNSTRNISVPGFVATANSDQKTGFAGVKLRAGHLFEFGGEGGSATWYLKPQVDVNGTYVNVQNFAERGAGALNLIVAGNNETIFSVSPGLEIGGALHVDGGTVVRPWVRAGATFFDNTSSTISATFQGSPTGVTPFRFTTELDDTFFDIATGMNVLWDSGVELRLNYDGRFSENSEEHTGGIKMGFKF